MNAPTARPLVVLAVFALLGVIFAGVSTYDFVAHLDRQVHAITCSFVPGLAARDTAGTSGCHATLMSPYSSVFRGSTWGGIPIALPGLAVFGFLLFLAADLFLGGGASPGAARFTLAATALPVAASVVYFLISMLKVGALCKLCAAIYVASLGTFVAALWLVRAARGAPGAAAPRAGLRLAEGVAFVLVPVVLYLALKPAYAAPKGGCGELMHAEDRYGVLLALGGTAQGTPAIEVLDPLCPACKGFRQRLDAGGFERELALKTVFFPLDKDCNWMVSESLHPGSCAVAEAVLCAGERGREVLDWAFRNQAELRDLGAKGAGAVVDRIKRDQPQVAACLGQPAVKQRLNRSLRWAVANSLPVVTPQLYVRGKKVCDEDTDLGLEYVLPRLLAAGGDAGRR